jgi:hypothetical protein
MKRCKNPALDGQELCKKCLIKCKYGKITDVITTDSPLYKTYKKKNPQFESVNGIFEDGVIPRIFCEYREEDYMEVMRKKEKQISRNNSINTMNSSIDIETIYNDIDKYINLNDVKSLNIDDVSTLHNTVIKQKNEIVKKMRLRLSIAETEEFYDKIMGYIKNICKKNNSIEDKIQNAEMIILREFNNEADLYIIDEKDEENPYHLYYKTKSGYMLVGYGRNWIDADDEVPREHKNYENIVLDEDTRVPILEIEITRDGSFITGIQEGIYREWEYDDEMEQFRKTMYIERL